MSLTGIAAPSGSLAWRGTLAAIALLVAGCATPPPLAHWRTPAAPDFRQPGPVPVNAIAVSRLEDIEADGCIADVELFAPPGTNANNALIFAHGFLHDVSQHRELAQHLASWSVPTYLVGLCQGGWTGGGAQLFAKLLRAVADRSGRRQIIYGGFSAGGSAAYLAASKDSRAIGMLGLDPVGHGRADHVRATPFPAYGLFGPGNRCNAQQSGRSLFQVGSGDVVREIAGAAHCHFESPTDTLCRLACGEPGDQQYLHEIRSRIHALATAYTRWRAGLDSAPPDAWWRQADGVIREPAPLSRPPTGPAFTH